MTEENSKKMSRRHPFSLFENIDDDWAFNEFSSPSGLTVSEDDAHVYVEAALPGIKIDEIEMVFDKGVVWIKGEKKEETEDRKKKFYRKAMSTFSYRVAVPGDVDESKEPNAVIKNGVLRVTFFKTKEARAKKIPIIEG